MARKKATVALQVDGEEPLTLQSDAPGVLLGRGGRSSTFLRKYLTDASISREHVRVQAIADNDDGGGGSEGDTAAAPPRVRVSVVGSNPVLLVRRKPPGGKTYIHRGQSAVAEVGDGFRFCRGFDKVVRVVTASQPPPFSSRQEPAGSREDGKSGDDGDRARDLHASSSAVRDTGEGVREDDGSGPDGGLAGGAAVAKRGRRGGGESESGVRPGANQASAAAPAAASGESRCAAAGEQQERAAAVAVAPAATVAASEAKTSAGLGGRGASPEKPASDPDAGSDGRRLGGDVDGYGDGDGGGGGGGGVGCGGGGTQGKSSGGEGKGSVEGGDKSATGRSNDGEEDGRLNHESGGASCVTAGNVSEGGGAGGTQDPMKEAEEEEGDDWDGSDRQDGDGRSGEKEHQQRRRRQRQGLDKHGDGAQGSPPPPPVAASEVTALASSRINHGVASSSLAAAAAATTLRVALVGRGFSKNQQEVFRKNGSKLGMEVLVRPEAKVGKPPNLFEPPPGATPGKGKKRRRSSCNERHHRTSQPPPPPPPPPPPSPPRQFVAGGSGSGGGGLLEQLRRERFTVAVCWSEELAPWAELLGPTAAEEGVEVQPGGAGVGLGGGGGRGGGGGGRGASGGGVEVVGHQWLVSCLQQNRRVDTKPYLLSPLKKDNVVGEEEDEGEEEGGGEPAFVVPMYACQRPTPMKHHNHEITDVLDAMTKMYKVVGDGQRADSFMRLSSILRFLDRRIRSGSEIRHVRHVGERMAEAVDEILATGTLSRLEELKSHPRNQVCQQLMKVHGVGSKTAKEWYNRGIRSVEDARSTLLPKDDGTEGDDERPYLKPEVVMGLKHFHDMQVPIGRDEVVGIADEVREEAERFGRERDPEGTVLFEVCGGFRRGKETLHDVDVLVSFRRGNGEPGHQGFVEGLKERLTESGKLCATLYQGQMGGFTKPKAGQTPQPKLEREEVLMALWQLPGRKCRIDIVQVALPQWPFALLGWSGTVMFEKDVRRYTEEQTEYKLSQKGVTIRATEEPVTDVASFQTEEDIFRFLGLEYIPPHLRWV